MRYKLVPNGDLQLIFDPGLERAVLEFLHDREVVVQFDEDMSDNRYAITLASKTRKIVESLPTDKQQAR
jgi:hypothetical protein